MRGRTSYPPFLVEGSERIFVLEGSYADADNLDSSAAPVWVIVSTRACTALVLVLVLGTGEHGFIAPPASDATRGTRPRVARDSSLFQVRLGWGATSGPSLTDVVCGFLR